MSLILEALRKSEVERRRGQAPDLLTDTVPNMPAGQTRSRDVGMIAMVTGGVLIAVLLMVAWLRTDTTQPASARASGEDTLAAKAAVTPPGPLQPPRLQPPALRKPAQPSGSAGDAIARPNSPTSVSAAPDEDAANVPDVDLPRPAPAVAETPASAPLPDTAPPTTFASPDVPLRLSDLSTEERQQLPALKVSMHMWAPDAANRFAIIDGTRINEGDRIGDAAVEAIQQDGVMLAWRGRRIRLPIR